MQIHLSEVSGQAYKIVKREPVKLTISNQGNQELLISAKTKLAVAIPCSRCLKDVITEFCLDFSREVDMKISDEERGEQMDENNYIAGYELNVDALIADEMVLQWPMKVLCKEDCKGICPVCGKDLNQQECECDRTVLDPRMAAFLDIFDQFKEV